LEQGTIVSTIAEIAIALAGFTGVVAVLGHRSQGTWSSAERLQLRVLVETSLTVLFASLVPGLLLTTSMSDAAVWRAANLVLAALHTANFAAFGIRAQTAETTKSQRALIALGVATILAHILAALAVVPWYSTIFVFGLIQQLFIASLNFLLLLFPLESSA